ncbi:sulfotransferase [Pseudoalteromonas sp. KJ10-2]|uniref:sulfotransferase n=1 Tax=Psychromonas sp. KJ10-2 TaxID=3391822 RepID=UPI0039B6AE8D
MKCIFIGGADRSGTTMLASLLSTIKDSVVTPESLFKTDIPFEYPISIHAYSQNLAEDKRFKRWNTDISELKDKDYLSYSEVYHDILSLYAQDKSVGYWIDHSPNNLMYAKLLNATFEDCYFIHIVRDGRAVAHSQIPLEWGKILFYTHLELG